VKDTHPPSVLSSWTRVILDALTALDIDPAPVLHATGFTADAFRDPNARLPARATARLWRQAAARAEDPAFGLFASRFVRPTTFHALGYAVFASSSLRDAFDRLLRYSHLVSDAGRLQLCTRGSSARLSVIAQVADAPSAEALDAVMSLFVRTCRALTNRSFTLLRIEQRRSRPARVQPYERFYRCPVSFACDEDALTFASDALDRTLPTANPELARHNDELVQRYLAQMSEGTVVDQVRRALTGHLSREPSPRTIARVLGTSTRSLQRHLQEHGTSFAEVMRETRCELARSYLRDPRCSITEITFLLGFEDASAFARAFRCWTGMSPSEYRAQT
jgi:AraC-like DNA-binding protein